MPKPSLKSTQIKKIFYYIAETGSLTFSYRTHKRSLINTFDTIASHSFHTGIIAYCLSRMEGQSHEEGLKALAMGVLHDNAEARTVDLDFPAKHYGSTDEQTAFTDQLKGLPFGKDLKQIIDEYEERETLVAKCAKDADAFEQLYLEWILTQMGNKMAKRWFLGDFKNRVPYFRTKSAKILAQVMKKSQPHDWWWEELIEKNLNHEHLNSRR